MSALRADEIVPGLVVHCDPEILRVTGGCYVKVEPGAETRDDHYFLIVEVDAEKQKCLATPLFSEKKDIRDRILLVEDAKTGKSEIWKNSTSYFYKWQFWCITFKAFIAASIADDSAGDRRFYGRDDAKTIQDVKADLHRLRQPWRPWNSN